MILNAIYIGMDAQYNATYMPRLEGDWIPRDLWPIGEAAFCACFTRDQPSQSAIQERNGRREENVQNTVLAPSTAPRSYVKHPSPMR